MYKFHVTTRPVAQPRHRHTTQRMPDGRMISRTYVPSTHPVTKFKADVRAVASARFDTPSNGPVMVDVLFLMPRPKRLVWKTRDMPRVPCDRKPDIDNLVKSLLDALTGIVWFDDSQVTGLVAAKCYASGHEKPGIEVVISAGELRQ